MFPPLCTRCGKNISVISSIKIEGDRKTKKDLCLECAKELGMLPEGIELPPELAGLMKPEVFEEAIEEMSDEEFSATVKDAADAAFKVLGSMRKKEDNPDLTEAEIGSQTIFDKIFEQFGGGASEETSTTAQASTPFSGEQEKKTTVRHRSKKRKYIDQFCVSLTEKAKKGKMDKTIGRRIEIARIVQILNRRKKNNPCLIGEPGVGKTAIAEGLAQFALSDKGKLRDKEILQLDITALVAGTIYRGQFEERMNGLIREITALGNIILFIDEIHMIVGAGEGEGRTMDAANILKPALANGDIQVIGATTQKEYTKHIEKDSALERRFQPVKVDEPTVDETVQILRGVAKYYEEFHGVLIPTEVLHIAVDMSERYITDRFLPDKAIDLIDEACSEVNIKNPHISEKISLQKELLPINEEIEDMIFYKNSDSYYPEKNEERKYYEQMSNLRIRKDKIIKRLDEISKLPQPKLTVKELANVIELWTKIPASRIEEAELLRLAKLDERLKAHIKGQDEAVDAIAMAIRRSRAGISPKRKPSSFIFVGPTGVGKTELVKRLSEDLFDGVDSLIRVDMSELQEKYSISRLIGTTAGYVGYDDGNSFSDKVRRNPYSVVLFDEIEKAHPDVLNILLQVLDDGYLTDGHGRKINFENTVIVMTSNAGGYKQLSLSGFAQTTEQHSKDKIMKALSEFLRPEFINRVDEIVVFNHLTEENFKEIALLMLRELADNLLCKDMHFTWDNETIDVLTQKSFSEKYGARNLRRTIQKEIENKIAMLMMDAQTYPEYMKAKVENDEIQVFALQ